MRVEFRRGRRVTGFVAVEESGDEAEGSVVRWASGGGAGRADGACSGGTKVEAGVTTEGFEKCGDRKRDRFRRFLRR